MSLAGLPNFENKEGHVTLNEVKGLQGFFAPDGRSE
jgi:hypothetical protein